MESFANHELQTFCLNVKSFNIVRAITDSDFFEKADISPTARLIMFSLANMYNPKSGYVFPKNKKLEKCTGCKTRAVISAMNELKKKGLILILQDEGYRKIYFTRKTYENLGLIKEEVSENINAKNAGDYVKNAQESAKNAHTCHEQKKEQNKKHYDFKNLRNDQNDNIEKLLFRESFVTDKQRSEIILNGYHRYNVKSDRDLKNILLIKEFWKFNENSFPILEELQKECLNNELFSKKIQKFAEEITFSLEKHKERVDVIRQSWQEKTTI